MMVRDLVAPESAHILRLSNARAPAATAPYVFTGSCKRIAMRGPAHASETLESPGRRWAMTINEQKSPRIASCRWGRVSIDGYGTMKDAKLYPGGARAWDWRETGTRHDPGIQPADIIELIQQALKPSYSPQACFGCCGFARRRWRCSRRGAFGCMSFQPARRSHLQSTARDRAGRRADSFHLLRAWGDKMPRRSDSRVDSRTLAFAVKKAPGDPLHEARCSARSSTSQRQW
jgi:hypothetical protein